MPLESAPEAGSSSQPRRTTKETHPNLPPGLILDAEGKVCKVCNSWQDWAKIKTHKKGSSSGSSKSAARMSGFAAMLGNNVPKVQSESTETTPHSSSSPESLDRKDCPPDTGLLGRSTWTFLHTTAAYYPLQASTMVQEHAANLVSSLAALYPCRPCADDFREKVQENPPDFTGRVAFSRWLCERHNEVNEKLGKERFDCDWSALNRRWRDGPEDGGCD